MERYCKHSQNRHISFLQLSLFFFLCIIRKVSQQIKPTHKRTKTFFLTLRSSCRQINKKVEPVRPMEGISPNSCTRPVLEKKARPQEQLNCPRCNSTNTKFCYYNNYSLTQPRYFCKTCRRYWTEGGSLRNVPVGGGSRKNKKVISASPSSAASPKVPDLNPPSLSSISSQNPKMQGGHDLNLAFPAMEKYHGMSPYVEMPKLETGDASHHSSSSAPNCLSAVELLRSGMAPRGLNPYVHSLMPNSNALYPPGYPMQEIKPNLGFSVDGLGNRSYGVQENGRLLFPFGEIKQLSAGVEVEQNKEQGNSTGYWTGMIGEGGSSW